MSVKSHDDAASAPPPDHVVALLGTLLDGLRREIRAAQASRAGLDDEMRTLRSSQLRLLSLTPPQGLRVTDLADRLGMSKQALGEFATALEERGLLESVRDPADRRVRILRPTRRGLLAAAQTTDVITEVEQRWRERLGAQRWDQLRELLVAAAASGTP